MESRELLRTTTSTGATKIIRAKVQHGQCWVEAECGKVHECRRGVFHLPSPQIVNGIAVTHSIGKIALKADEAEIVEAGFARFEADYAATPEAQGLALRAARKALSDQIHGIYQDSREDANRAWEREDETGWAQRRADGDAKIERVRAELKAFDEAHPEVLAKLQAEEQARKEYFAQHMWEN